MIAVERETGQATESEPAALSVLQLAARLGIGRSLVHRLVATGEIRSAKVGSRRLIPMSEVNRILNELA